MLVAAFVTVYWLTRPVGHAAPMGKHQSRPGECVKCPLHVERMAAASSPRGKALYPAGLTGEDVEMEVQMKRGALALCLLCAGIIAIPAVGRAATVAEAAAAGARAMGSMNAERKAWLRTLPPKDQQLMICVELARLKDQPGVVALDCEAVAEAMPKEHVQALVADWKAYKASDGRMVLTGNDMARIAPEDRAAVRMAVACRNIRTKITAQVSLMRQGSTGYWNMPQLQQVERQTCGDNMEISGH